MLYARYMEETKMYVTFLKVKIGRNKNIFIKYVQKNPQKVNFFLTSWQNASDVSHFSNDDPESKASVLKTLIYFKT